MAWKFRGHWPCHFRNPEPEPSRRGAVEFRESLPIPGPQLHESLRPCFYRQKLLVAALIFQGTADTPSWAVEVRLAVLGTTTGRNGLEPSINIRLTIAN